MKKFTVPCDFGGQKAPFDVYIGNPKPGNHPLQNQASWLSKERGGTIPQEVMESFQKLLDLAEKNINLSEAIIIETGGMKGRRKEISKKSLHLELMKGLNVPFVSSEYGMTELLSQAYSFEDGIFSCPPWMKVLFREVHDPLTLIEGNGKGAINVIDLANIHSCSFIATQDLGRNVTGGFILEGRMEQSDLRGCNLMVD